MCGIISHETMPVNDALLHNWFYGNRDVRIAAAMLFAFLICSIPMEAIVAWLFEGVDPRLATVAKAFVPFINALKGYISTVISFHGGGPAIGFACAFAATLGHCYSPWRRFRGGERIDANAGILCALDPRCAIVTVIFFFVTYVTAREARIATLFAAALMFLPLWYWTGPYGALMGIGTGALLALRIGMGSEFPERVHVENFNRSASPAGNEATLLQLE